VDSRKRTARLAGALYWLAGLPAPFVLLYVPGLVTVRGDAAATALKIRAQETLFQLNIFGHLWNLVFFIFLAMALYQLLSHVNKARAALMVILVLVSLPISFLGLLADVGILVLLRGGDYLAAFSKDQLDSLVYFLLVMRGKAIVVAQIFWGLWLLPLGLLIMRSRFIPRLLGVLLIPNGIAYPVMSLTGLFFPAYSGVVWAAMLPALLGELWVMLWLVIRGTRDLPAGERDRQPVLKADAAVPP